jgi:hypothetical protein
MDKKQLGIKDRKNMREGQKTWRIGAWIGCKWTEDWITDETKRKPSTNVNSIVELKEMEKILLDIYRKLYVTRYQLFPCRPRLLFNLKIPQIDIKIKYQQ